MSLFCLRIFLGFWGHLTLIFSLLLNERELLGLCCVQTQHLSVAFQSHGQSVKLTNFRNPKWLIIFQADISMDSRDDSVQALVQMAPLLCRPFLILLEMFLCRKLRVCEEVWSHKHWNTATQMVTVGKHDIKCICWKPSERGFKLNYWPHLWGLAFLACWWCGVSHWPAVTQPSAWALWVCREKDEMFIRFDLDLALIFKGRLVALWINSGCWT